MSATIRGYVIVDKITNAIDWDCELHPTREAAIESMCGPWHIYVKSPEGVDPSSDYLSDYLSVYWAEDYDICEVR